MLARWAAMEVRLPVFVGLHHAGYVHKPDFCVCACVRVPEYHTCMHACMEVRLCVRIVDMFIHLLLSMGARVCVYMCIIHVLLIMNRYCAPVLTNNPEVLWPSTPVRIHARVICQYPALPRHAHPRSSCSPSLSRQIQHEGLPSPHSHPAHSCVQTGHAGRRVAVESFFLR